MAPRDGVEGSSDNNRLDRLTAHLEHSNIQEVTPNVVPLIRTSGPPEKQNPAALVAIANRAKAGSTEQGAFHLVSYLTARADAIAAMAEPPFDAETLALIDILDELVPDPDAEPALGWTLAGRIGSTDDREGGEG